MEIAAGILIGLLIGLTGVGGGVVTVPILVLGLGIPPATAVGTALLFTAVVKLPVAAVYGRRGQVDGRALRLLLVGGLPGVALGSLALRWLALGAWRGAIQTLVGATIAATAVVGLVRVSRGSTGAVAGIDARRKLALVAFPIGAEVGFSSAGAGALGSMALLHWTSLSPAAVVGTDVAFGLVVSLVGGALHWAIGEWSVPLLARLVAGGVPGAVVGALLAGRAPQRALRVTLLTVLLGLGIEMARRGLLSL